MLSPSRRPPRQSKTCLPRAGKALCRHSEAQWGKVGARKSGWGAAFLTLDLPCPRETPLHGLGLPPAGSPGGGGGKEGAGRAVDFSGYAEGAGNVETGTWREEGTGFDEHGQVKTRFGNWGVAYDPVTGAATRGVTSAYDFPLEGEAAGAGVGVGPVGVPGLSDLSLPAPGHATVATGEGRACLGGWMPALCPPAPAPGG